MSSAPVKVLFYAINGTGLGHLSRLLNIAREVGDLLSALGLQGQIQFLTTSEGSEIAGEFPVYKIPSKTIIKRSAMSPAAYTAQAKLLISNLVAGFKPDILILDTVPEGSFKEFLFLKEYARKTAFVYRHMSQDRQSSETVQSHLALYDLIMIPDEESFRDHYRLPPRHRAQAKFVGIIQGYRGDSTTSLGFSGTEWERFDRATVRRYFNVPRQARVIYLSAGGGGDGKANEYLQTFIDVLASDATNHLLVAYGPLYQGPRTYRENVIPLSEPGVSRYFPGLDLAISAAGYNSYNELLAASVPTLFYAQDKGWDRQDERILMGVQKGWHGHLTSFDPVVILSQVNSMLDPEKRRSIVDTLEARHNSRGSERAALALLNEASTIRNSAINRRELHFARVVKTHYRSESPSTFPKLFRAAWTLEKSFLSPQERDDFTDAARWSPQHTAWGQRCQGMLSRGAVFMSWLTALDWRGEELLNLIRACYQGAQDNRSEHFFLEFTDIIESAFQFNAVASAGQYFRSCRKLVDKKSLFQLLKFVNSEFEDGSSMELVDGLVELAETQQDDKLELQTVLLRLGIQKEETQRWQ
jgi:UDP-N-acetylglucosamine--N-acetylmuramyl-(pentapeptide) pyrophosphoryl-undecaprenol N-acetylglucosamine transferase